jgi:hypothetical protein
MPHAVPLYKTIVFHFISFYSYSMVQLCGNPRLRLHGAYSPGQGVLLVEPQHRQEPGRECLRLDPCESRFGQIQPRRVCSYQMATLLIALLKL